MLFLFLGQEAATLRNALNGGGVVSGIIRGLSCGGITPATSVEVRSNTVGLSIGEYIGSPLTNTWTHGSNCEVLAFNFLSAGVLNAPLAVIDTLIFFDSTQLSGAIFRAGVAPSPAPFVTGSGFVSTQDVGLTFSSDCWDHEQVCALAAKSAAAAGELRAQKKHPSTAFCERSKGMNRYE